MDPRNNFVLPSELTEVSRKERTVGKIGRNDFVFLVRGERYVGKVLPAWDWEQWRPTLVFTGISKRGIALWAKKHSLSEP